MLFERGKLGEWGVRIRLLVAPARTAARGLCVILFAFCPLDTIAAFAPRSFTTSGVALPIRALVLALHPVMAVMTLLPFFPLRPATIMRRAARASRRLCGLG
ncbi:MAG: hypothetical protein WA662_22110, partial [Pseudolabrys sp.]